MHTLKDVDPRPKHSQRLESQTLKPAETGFTRTSAQSASFATSLCCNTGYEAALNSTSRGGTSNSFSSSERFARSLAGTTVRSTLEAEGASSANAAVGGGWSLLMSLTGVLS